MWTDTTSKADNENIMLENYAMIDMKMFYRRNTSNDTKLRSLLFFLRQRSLKGKEDIAKAGNSIECLNSLH